MKNILIHGLGQNSKDWDTIKNELVDGAPDEGDSVPTPKERAYER